MLELKNLFLIKCLIKFNFFQSSTSVNPDLKLQRVNTVPFYFAVGFKFNNL